MGGLQRPIAAVVTNFPQAQGGRPSLLSLGEVGTLFHEFGHALQQVLSIQNETAVSGINGVEWDAVEVASQFMEYWVNNDRRTLDSIAKHYNTSEPLPEAMYKQLQEAKYFRSGTDLLSQIYLSRVDLGLHLQYEADEDPDAMVKSIAKKVLVFAPLPESRMLCSFGHIFSGGYAAGYYSYLWSKVLSADAFSAFDSSKGDKAGLADAEHVQQLGKKFASTLLALGGGRDPAKVYLDFRGQGPTSAALIRYSGIVPVVSHPLLEEQ